MSVLGLTLTLTRSSAHGSSRPPSRERPATPPAARRHPASASATHLRIPAPLDPIPTHTPGYSNSTSALPHFPGDLPDLPLPPPRFPIAPREEEGRETLPAYSCSLHIEAVLDHKLELSTPFARATHRSWSRNYFILHGTKLDVHTIGRGAGGLLRGGRTARYGPGRLVASYTLQLAEVGVAADYCKRSWVVRVRAEGRQFLLGFDTQLAQMQWLDALAAAIDLSPSLEERALPQHRTLPRRRRVRRVEPREEEAAAAMDAMEMRPVSRAVSAVSGVSGVSAAGQEEKWSPPQTQHSAEDVLRYAKRCMAVLCSDAPRQSELVIVQGKRYRLVYETREMVPDDGSEVPAITVTEPAAGKAGAKEVEVVKAPEGVRLPGYEEVVGAEEGPRRHSAVV